MAVCMLLDGGPSPGAATKAQSSGRKLKVCSDPDNLPFSNGRREGFENRIAEILARDLNARLEYTWGAQGRGQMRNTLNAGLCDVITGVPASVERLATPKPYYRSGYVFLSRQDRRLRVSSFDSPELRRLKIGVHSIGRDDMNASPVHALARRSLVRNIRAYRVLDDGSKPNSPARIIEAVAKGEIDIAVAGGPLAGFFARQQKTPLVLVPVPEERGSTSSPLAFDVSMAVRRSDTGLREELNAALERNRKVIDHLLETYGVPVARGR